ncbi:MAG TPA: hypothetical protein VGO90_10420, partial [Chthoniobacteraceae bacterium]|nr:hypothetical protein [Chthoniobacteraceae bacterium]
PFFGDREVHSTRLAAALRQMPRLIARLPHAAIAQEQFHPRDAHLLVTVGGDRGGATNFAAFWNLKTDKALQLSSGPGSEIDNVNFAAFSPVSVSGDGIIATAHGRRGGKGEVRLWSVKEALAGRAALLTTWPAPARVSRLVFSADGAAVALVLEREPGSDSEVRIHEVGQEKPPVAKQFTTGVNHVAFDPSGDLLAIACGTPLRGDRGEAVLWQWRQNTARTLVHAAPVNHAVFSPQGTQLLTASGADDSGGEARIWEVATGMPAALPPFAHRDNVPFASFSPDGERVATASRDNTARIWSRAHGFQIAELQHNGWVYEARFSPDGRHVVTSSRDRRARVWNADTGEPALPALNHSGTVLRATFSGDGRQVLAAGLDEARLWRLETGNLEVPPLAAADSVQVAAVSPDSTLAATATVATASASLVEVWRVADGHRAHTRRKLEGSVAAIAFTAQNRLVVAVGTTPAGGGFAALCDLQSEAPPRRREFKRPVTFVTAAHGAAPLLLLATATGNERGEAILWNHATDEAHTIAGPSAVVFATFAPNDETFLVAGGSRVTPSGFAQIWDTASRTPVCPAVEHLETVEAAAFNRDGSLFATASVDDSANVWNARTGRSESVRIRGVHTADVQAIAFSPNGDAILTGSYDGTAAYVKWKGWKDGDPTSVFRHQGAVNVVTFSPDGRRILTASDDQTARVWERSSGNLIALLRHGEEVRDARFAEDGRAVAVLATSRPPMLGSTRNTRDAEAEKFLRRAETRRWQLAPGEASLQTMLEEAQILANAKLQPPSRLVPLKTPAAVRPLVPERLPSQSGDEPVGELAFHLVQARHCETEQNWFATAWHLGRAVECARAGRHPAYELAALEERRGEAFYQLRRWEEAVPAFTAALELLGDSETARRGQIHARRVWARIESRDFAGATEDCHTLAQLWPRSHDPWTFLAWLHLEQNQLSALRSALQTGIERDPKAVTPWQRRAAAELWYGEGDASNYRVVCTEMWEKFRGTKGVGTRLAWPCCLAPDSGVDPSVLVSAVEETLKERPENYTDLNTYGAVLLRANRIDEAIGVLDRSRAAFIKARGSELQRLAAAGASSIAISDGRPQDWVLLALAWSRKGDRQRASHWVHKVEVALEQMGSGSRNEASTPRTPWSRIELELLRREAAAEIRKMSNDPTTAHSGL